MTDNDNQEATTERESSSNKHLVLEQMDGLLEREMQNNKNEIWAKLDKSMKLQKLACYAETFGRANRYSQREINDLVVFLTNSINNGKLKKNKDVTYNKDTKEITQIPGLLYDVQRSAFTLKNMDKGHVSTLKSLTPKNPNKAS
jgi:hypothetical protein